MPTVLSNKKPLIQPTNNRTVKINTTTNKVLLKILEDQKLVSKLRKDGLSFSQISKQYGFQFKTV